MTPLHPRSFRRHPQERIKKWKRTFGYRGSYSLQSHSVIPEEVEVLVHAENIVQLPPEAAGGSGGSGMRVQPSGTGERPVPVVCAMPAAD